MHSSLGSLFALLGLACAAGAEAPLFDFGPTFDTAAVKTTDVKVTRLDGKLALAVGHAVEWPGIQLAAPGGHWDLSKFETLTLAVKNTSEHAATLCCRVDNTGADGVHNCNTGSVALDAGATGTLTVTFRRAPQTVPGVNLFGMRGYPVNGKADGTIDPGRVVGLVIFVPKPKEASSFEIGPPTPAGTYAGPAQTGAPQQFLPFIDTFGQYVHRDWPGKVHSLAELQGRVAEEEADLAAHAGPAGWDKWGGWAAGPQLEATGFFRTAKHEGRWWLVDPDGRLFWSHGVDCVGAMHATPIDERESWWLDFPGNQPDLKEFLGGPARTLHGHYAPRNVKTYSFSFANLKRKYGADYKDKWFALAHRRLRSWGHNTIGNWSNGGVLALRQTPYTATVYFSGKLLAGSQGYWGQFRDVFDPSFAAGIKTAMAGQVGKGVGDPWCLGFFVDNEIAWGDDTSLAVAALVSPKEQRAKQVFVDDLKAKYETIGKLNEVWGTHHASWGALLDSRDAPDKQKARADLNAFYSKTAETYFKTISEAVHAAAPKQLYLGCRFAWVNDLAAKAGGKYCDVVSYNLYRKSIAEFKTPAGDVPLLVGEFHFGALDRGMFHTGLVPVSTQEARAKAYRDYVTGALRHPQFVGTHWFEFQDEPVTGRSLDEENYQIGLIDQADTPYRETIAATREVGYDLYKTRTEARK